jgi:anti-sigma factor RsiW
VIGRPHHLNDERLLDRYLAVRSGEVPDPPAAEHLADCRECTAHYDELAGFMDSVRADADAETDAVFPTERLRLQQQQIGRRLEAVGRPPRVITFPARLAGSKLSAGRSGGITRWKYGAAAASLILVGGIGAMGVGAIYDSMWRPAQRARVFATPRPARLAPVATDGNQPAPDPAADDAFLSDLELALERPRTRELQAFDALTPHVRAVSDKAR